MGQFSPQRQAKGTRAFPFLGLTHNFTRLAIAPRLSPGTTGRDLYFDCEGAKFQLLTIFTCMQYFSSLERLRLAQASGIRPKSSSGKSHHYAPTGSSSISPKSPRPILIQRNSSYFKSPSLRRSRKTPSPTCDAVSPSDAQWFLRLPDKIQQKHFTREERLLLSGQSEAFIPDAADERVIRSFFQQGREANRSVPTLSTSSSSSVSTRSTCEGEHFVDQTSDMDESDFDGFRWIENDDDHDLASTLHLDDYHEFMNQAAEPSPAPAKRRPSFRRALSVSSLPYGGNLPKPLGANQTTSTPSSSMPQSQGTHGRQRSCSYLRTVNHNKNTSITKNDLEPSAVHYTDPNARLKLRVYLASPQKFDEAIEFGFPSMEDKENLHSLPKSRRSLSRNHNTTTCTTYLYDDSPSIFDALDDDDDDDDDGGSYYEEDTSDAVSLPGPSSPYTPLDIQFPDTYLLSSSEITSKETSHAKLPTITTTTTSCTDLSITTSSTALFSRPTVRHNFDKDDPYMQALSGCGREMTLHMTLTRPDLRGDGSELTPGRAAVAAAAGSGRKGPYIIRPRITPLGTGVDDDPLALEHLQLSEGVTGDIWDTLPLPKENSLCKRMWKIVSGKGPCCS